MVFVLSALAYCSQFLGAGARFRTTRRPSAAFSKLAVGFLLLSIDETALLHERTTEALEADTLTGCPLISPVTLVSQYLCPRAHYVCSSSVSTFPRSVAYVAGASLIGAAGCVVYVTGAAVLETVGQDDQCRSVVSTPIRGRGGRVPGDAGRQPDPLRGIAVLRISGKRPAALERSSVSLSISLPSLSEV